MTQAKGAGPQGGEVAETAWLHARSGPPRGAPRFSQRLGSCCVDSPMTATDFGDKVVGSAAASATSSPVPEPVAQAAASTTRPRPSPRPGWCCEPGPLLLSFLVLPGPSGVRTWTPSVWYRRVSPGGQGPGQSCSPVQETGAPFSLFLRRGAGPQCRSQGQQAPVRLRERLHAF